MKVILVSFLLLTSIGVMAQDSDNAAIHKELFDLKSKVDKLKSELASVNKVIHSGTAINGDAIKLLSDYIEEVNTFRKNDSVYFESRLAGLKNAWIADSNDAMLKAYKQLDSLRVIEAKLTKQ